MTENSQERKQKKSSGCLAEMAYVKLLVCFACALFFPIQGDYIYSWLMGLLHGFWAPFYAVISLFSDTYAHAPLHDGAYDVTWWIGVAFIAFYIIYAVALTFKRRRINK